MVRHACMFVAMLGLSMVVGCGGVDSGSRVAAPQGTTTRTFSLKGVVKGVDEGSGEVTIAHEDVPGFMPRMTMPFSMKVQGALGGIRPGDEVEGPLVVSFEGGVVKDVELTGLKVTRAASPNSTPPVVSFAPPPLSPGDMVPDFAMTTQDGSALRLSDLKGQVVILTFIYTRCPLPEFCPAMDAKFADLDRRIATVPSRAARFRLLSVSFDPENDTPEVLAAHAERRGAKPPLWTFAVASHEELARVAGGLGMAYTPGTREIAHNLRTAVIDPEGRLARLETGAGWSPAELLKAALGLVPVDPKGGADADASK